MSIFEATIVYVLTGSIVLVALLVVAAFLVPIKVKRTQQAIPAVIPFTVHHSDSQAFNAGRYEINLKDQTLTRLGDL